MRLDFVSFMTESQKTGYFLKHPLISFTGLEYPILFFMQLRCLMQRDSAVEIIDSTQEDTHVIISRLSTSFLGQSRIYFITGMESASRSKEAIMYYLENYSGPHNVVLYIPEDKIDQDKPLLSKQVCVHLPDRIDKGLFNSLLMWFGVTVTPQVKSFVLTLFNRFDYIQFEQACVVMRYVPLGINENMFFEEWLDTIITPEQSMFSVSQYLFQKDSRQFFIQWNQVSQAYSLPFWIVFWSEQLWRASMFIILSKQRKYSDARKIAFRLPFSFINRDWRNYEAQELIAAHDFLYQLDYRTKNSDNSIGLDLFYSRFLSDLFCSKKR